MITTYYRLHITKRVTCYQMLLFVVAVVIVVVDFLVAVLWLLPLLSLFVAVVALKRKKQGGERA